MCKASLEVFTKYQKIICLIFQAFFVFDKTDYKQYNKAMIKADEIIKSKRKTLSLSLDKDGRVIVRAPYKCSEKRINEFVLSNQGWLEKATESFNKSQSKVSSYSVSDGGRIPLLGEDFEILFTDNKKAAIDKRVILLPEKNSLSSLEKMLKTIALNYFKERLDYYSSLSGLEYNRIKITKAKTRWGSCNSDKNICFSLYLVMCPLNVIDYVIVHEMCHLKYMNHSKKFWAEVEKYIPDYGEKRKWLRDNRAIVNII